MKKWVCPVCGYVHEGDTPPEFCPQCKVPGSKFIELKESEKLVFADEHKVGIAKAVEDEEILAGLKANFEGECTEVLLDVPRIKTFINGYSSTDETLNAIVEKLCGRSEFKGTNPIDPFCGKWDTRL